MTIVKVLEVPRSISRSKALITLYGGHYDPTQGQNAASQLGSMFFIGNVTSIEIPVNRGSAERRELNASTLGQILEIVPGLVDFEGITLNHVVTYQSTFMEACQFGGHNLSYQSVPLFLVFVLPTPNASFAPVKNLLLESVWIKGNPLTFSVEDKDDLRITQAVPLAVGNISEL